MLPLINNNGSKPALLQCRNYSILAIELSSIMKKYFALMGLVALVSVFTVGCGADTSTTVSDAPPPMTEEEKAAQAAHYAAPSPRDR